MQGWAGLHEQQSEKFEIKTETEVQKRKFWSRAKEVGKNQLDRCITIKWRRRKHERTSTNKKRERERDREKKGLPHAATKGKLSKRQSCFVSCVPFASTLLFIFQLWEFTHAVFAFRFWKVRCLICIWPYFSVSLLAPSCVVRSHVHMLNAMVCHCTTSWCAPINMYGRDRSVVSAVAGIDTRWNKPREWSGKQETTNYTKKKTTHTQTHSEFLKWQTARSKLDRTFEVATSCRFAKLCE